MKFSKQFILRLGFISLAGLFLTACAEVMAAIPTLTPTPIVAQTEAIDIAALDPTPTTTPTITTSSPAAPLLSALSSEETHPKADSSLEPVANTTFVEWTLEAGGGIVDGAESTLIRMEHGFYVTFKGTNLEPGEAFTLWWVIFNKPENCNEGGCGLDDVFLMDQESHFLKTEEGANRPNELGRAAAEISQMWAAGTIVDEDGTAEFDGRLSVGDMNNLVFGPGLLDPMKTEVHAVIRTHGPAIPGLIHEQMTTPWGGCPEGWPKDPCKNLQFAIHAPPSDGQE